MRYTYSIRGDRDGPLIRDMPVNDGTSIVDGEPLAWGAEPNGSVLESSGALGANFVGVATETIVASTHDLTTGTLVFAKVILDPLAVYNSDYDLDEANDVDATAGDTLSVTVAAGDDNMDGGWVYVNSGAGNGQLAFIGAASTTVYTFDTTDALGTALDATSDLVLVRRQGLPTGGNDLNAAGTLIASLVSATGAYGVIQNYIETSKIDRHPLHPRNDHARSGLSNADLILSADIYPLDHAYRGPETI